MNEGNNGIYLTKYFSEWIELYKFGSVTHVTYAKYTMTLRRLTEIAPELKLCDLDRRRYQGIINEYAKTHERATVFDFHHHLQAAIKDAIDEDLLKTDPTRKTVIKGKPKTKERLKFLSKEELKKLLGHLDLRSGIYKDSEWLHPNWDYAILLAAKTSLRFAEIIGLTPSDFDFVAGKVTVSKTWDYKSSKGFAPTKNQSSMRTIAVDRPTLKIFARAVKCMRQDKPIFAQKDQRVYNSTANGRLRELCKSAGIPKISIHGLRHTHASLLIFEGVSVASVAKRLGHSNITTTQETYIHIIRELEDKDNAKVVKLLAEL